MAEWSNEKILNFINEIRVRPELWDVEAIAYRDRNLKKDSWAVIAAKFHVTPQDAYKKFRNLRTYAKTELKKKKESGVEKKVSWFAFEAISFILSRDIPDAGTDSESSMIETTITENRTHNTEEIMNFEETSNPLTCPPPPKTSRKKKHQMFDAAKYERATEILNSCVKERNPHSGFGEHIAYKLSTYDSFTQAQVQFQISKVLYNADIGMLRNGQYNVSNEVPDVGMQTTQESQQNTEIKYDDEGESSRFASRKVKLEPNEFDFCD